ncbi:hypothetical protein I6F26_20470 [Ensifer sp. IC3342]|nr:hypothetical protein [Ensifer sp. BRP08]MCA1448954.1 hypothetical protein [Ensifer sp. IC3342]THK36035.1 hypothetical protein EHS39_22045 [Ensifer sp. MPMI2T]
MQKTTTCLIHGKDFVDFVSVGFFPDPMRFPLFGVKKNRKLPFRGLLRATLQTRSIPSGMNAG